MAKEGYKVFATDTYNNAFMTDYFGIENPGTLEGTLEGTLYHLMMADMNEDDLPPKERYILKRDGVDVIASSIEV